MISRIDIIRVLLDNPELKRKYSYSSEDVEGISGATNDEVENEFISFVKTIVRVIEDNPNARDRVQVNKIFHELDL